MNIANNDAALRCPFCQQDNQCLAVELKSSAPVVNSEAITPKEFNSAANSVAKPKPNCWCFVQNIPQGLIDLVPQRSKGQRCICASCVANFIRDPEGFRAQYCRAAF